jgi:ribose transport system substrate-binding protein
LFADHPNALVIVPTDVTALKAPIEQYVNAHIPVVTADTTITDTSILSSRITCNNVEGGKMAADALASLVNDQGEVAVINNEPGVSTDDQRQDGFAQELQAKYPNMTIVATEYDNESVTTAEAQAAALVLAYPKLVGIFGIDVPSGEGLGQEIQSANLAGKVFGVSYDAVAAEVSFLKAGDLSALVMQQPAAEGSLAVQYAYDLITGQKGSVKDNVVMSDVLATTATASDPTISQYFYVNSLNGS